MQMIARIMLVLLTVLAFTGHGRAPAVVFHAHAHDHDADHAAHHDHSAAGQSAGIIVAVPASTDAVAPDCDGGLHHGGQCDGDHSGAHVHVSCCGTIMALPSTTVVVAPPALTAVDLPIGNASLTRGELRYPLLRPPVV
jgi:hypothetical protein